MFSHCGEFDPTRATVEQLRAEFVFEVFDLAAERRLHDMEVTGGLGHAAVFGDCQKITKMSKFHYRARWCYLCFQSIVGIFE